jgi:queuosine precursor transporter
MSSKTALLKMTAEQKMDFLLAMYVTAIIAAELLGSKVATLFGFNFSVGIFALPITFTINDIVSEVYGKERARSFIRAGLYMIVLLIGLTLISIALPPAQRFAASNAAYMQIFAKSTRIMLASLTAFVLSEFFDVYIYAKIRQKFGQKALWLRNNASNFISQFIDTFIFMMLAFWSPGRFVFVMSLILPYWLLKCAFSVAETPFTYLGVNWLKKTK